MRTAALILCLGALGRGAPPALAVLESDAGGIRDPGARLALRERTRAAAASTGRFSLLPSTESSLRPDPNGDRTCDAPCRRDRALAAGAELILEPSVERDAERLFLRFSLLDARTGEVLRESRVESDGRVGRAVDEGVAELAGRSAFGWPTRRFWVSAGAVATVVGGFLVLGLARDRASPAASSRAPVPGEI